MVREASRGSKRISSVNDKILKIKKIAPVAVGIIVPALIFSALVVARLPNVNDGGAAGPQATGGESASSVFYGKPRAGPQATGEGVFSYTEDIPLRYKPDTSARIVYRLFLPDDPQTGEKKKSGYLTQDGVAGVRINQDGSIWIIVIIRDEIYDSYYEKGQEVREDFYAPLEYFKTLPGASKVPCLKDINLG
ncbi:MAG: hypothetical protein JRJ65_00185 [Deltaproteobacteria bacterium]|nr:hypothetical protein [Deltaproteobacteria bacterium]